MNGHFFCTILDDGSGGAKGSLYECSEHEDAPYGVLFMPLLLQMTSADLQILFHLISLSLRTEAPQIVPHLMANLVKM